MAGEVLTVMVGVIHDTVTVHTDTDLITARFLTVLVIDMDTMTAIMQDIIIPSIIFTIILM